MSAPARAGAPAARAGVVVRIREATAADAPTLARHRTAMFRDMGVLRDAATSDALVAATEAYLARAMPAGEYHGWCAEPTDVPGHVIAGAGVQLRAVVPRPGLDGRVYTAEQALVLNVYTEPVWRRRGVGEALMRAVLAWAEARGVSGVVLHASAAGRAMYERLGFGPTNEMRFGGAPVGLAPGERVATPDSPR